jgi:hypothetical protein
VPFAVGANAEKKKNEKQFGNLTIMF